MQVLLIGDNEYVYRKILDKYYDDDKGVASAAFYGDDLSVDWSMFTSPSDSFARPPVSRCIVQLQARHPRKVGQQVLHTPKQDNYSHSSIIGDKEKQSIRRYMRNNSTIVFPENLGS